MRKVWVAVVGVLVVVLAACGGTDDGPRADEVGLDGTAWELTDGVVDEHPLEVPGTTRITLVLDDERATGRAGCNEYGASVETNGATIAIALLDQTDMGCEPAVMALERAYLAALPRIVEVERSVDGLDLTGDGVALRFVERAPVPLEALGGTTWRLESLVDGGHVVPAADGGILTLHDDGTLAGATGCRGFAGEYQARGDEIRFTTFVADGECSAELEAQDRHVVEVLGDGFRVTIEDGRLAADSTGGLGLVYRSG